MITHVLVPRRRTANGAIPNKHAVRRCCSQQQVQTTKLLWSAVVGDLDT